MGFLVQKFGGTSVSSPERIRSVAERIARVRGEGHRLLVVVSAMGHTTDELLTMARSVSQSPPSREIDMLLTAGERISMALLSMALADLSVPAVSFTGSQSGIITDSSHRRARIKRILGHRVRGALEQNQVAIVAGFQGVSSSKEITTLGRGGSDTTAVALAAALGAEACEIFTDVDGVFTADPCRVTAARHWRRLPYDLTLELAYRGAGVLHPRSVELAKKYKVPLWVKNSLKESEGTLVQSKESLALEGVEDFSFVGVTGDSARMPLEISLARPTVVGAVLERAQSVGLTVMAPLFQDGKLWIFIERESSEQWKTCLNQLVQQEFVKQYDFRWDEVPVSIVGECFSQDGSVFSRILELLANRSIPVTFAMSSAQAFTGAIPQNRMQDAIELLHSEFLK